MRICVTNASRPAYIELDLKQIKLNLYYCRNNGIIFQYFPFSTQFLLGYLRGQLNSYSVQANRSALLSNNKTKNTEDAFPHNALHVARSRKRSILFWCEMYIIIMRPSLDYRRPYLALHPIRLSVCPFVP